MVPGDRGGSEAGDEVVLDAVGAGGEEARDEVMAVGPTSRAGEDGELVAQQEVLRDEIGAGAEGRAEEGDEQQRAVRYAYSARGRGGEPVG